MKLTYKTQFKYSAILLTCCVSAALLTGCGKGNQESSAPPPALPVKVMTVKLQDISLDEEYTGLLEAARMAEIRARVTGIVQKRLFEEGSNVKKNQVLFQIDNAPYLAAYNKATAAYRSAVADYNKATYTEQRLKPLIKVNAISKQEYDNAKTALDQAAALVGVAKADMQNAKISLDYTRVSSPIDGKIGKAYITEGALVNQANGTLMAKVQQLDPMYISFNQSDSDIIKLQEAIRNGELQTSANTVPVKVTLSTGAVYNQTGKLLYEGITVDDTTGQINLKAEIPNPEHILMPGMRVRVSFARSNYKNAVLVPQLAVTRNKDGDSVLVVNSDGTFKPQPVTIAGSKEANWIITGGLNSGDMVIIEGTSRLGYGVSKVTPITEEAAAQQAAKQAAATNDKKGAK